MELPKDLRYTKDHEWVRPSGATWKVGITEFAQRQLGDVVFVDVPNAGKTISQGDAFGTVESVKAVSELYAPVAGEVVSVNDELTSEPELLNTDPYDDGWIIELKPSNPKDLDGLLTPDQYAEHIKAESSE